MVSKAEKLLQEANSIVITHIFLISMGFLNNIIITSKNMLFWWSTKY